MTFFQGDIAVFCRLRFSGVLWIAICALLLGGCAVRRVPPIRYVPLLGGKADASMEGILSKALEDKNPVVRRDAVKLLGTMVATPEEQRRTAEALGKALRDKEEDIRLEAVRALGNIASDISGPYLMRAMKDESVRVRVQVVQVLREAYQRQASRVQMAEGEGGAAP